MKKTIVTNLNELKKQSEIITDKNEIKQIIKDLEDTLKNTTGIGLSAIQIGIPKQVAIIRLGEFKLNLINPKILHKAGTIRVEDEGCLSLPGIRVDTKRYSHILLQNNEDENVNLEGLSAVVVQHEIAHMHGQTILDYKWRKR